MTTGEDLALGAMRKEHKRLSAIADKAKREADECSNIADEFIAIHKEFAAIVESKEHGQHVLDKLSALQRRRDKAKKILDKDLIKLLDRQHEAEWKRDQLGSEIQMMEFRQSLRQRPHA